MGSRKRGREEMEAEEPPKLPSTLVRLRNTWEFASLMQYLFTFGRAVKVVDTDIEDFEEKCLAPDRSSKLGEIGLALLKNVSSHKGLTPEIFDEYTRRQYLAKAPERNPFGDEEEPNSFAAFDLFQQLRILHQLSVWTFVNPDRIREKMNERDADQASWRIDPFGWDADDRIYFLLDDDRFYRRTDPALPDPAPKKKSTKKPKSKSRASRASKRLRFSEDHAEDDDEEDAVANVETSEQATVEENTLGGMKWECIAITLDEYYGIIESFKKSKDPNEKDLYKRLTDSVLPIIEKREEERQRKEEKRIKDLEIMEKLAMAKRSSRLAGKKEKLKEAEAAAEEERKRRVELDLVRKEQEKQRKMEAERHNRMMTREQRLKEREVKRILHEQELRRLEEDSKRLEQEESRISERHLKAEMERRQKELESLQEDEWIFDCSVCGKHGENYDDGEHSIECETCKVWQHSACHGINKEQAENENFHFYCKDCKKREEEAKKPQPLKVKMGPSPKSTKAQKAAASPHGLTKDGRPKKKPGRPRKNPLPEGAPNGTSPAANGVPSGSPSAAPKPMVVVDVNGLFNQPRPVTHQSGPVPYQSPAFSQTFGAPMRPAYFGPPQGYSVGGATAQKNETPRPMQPAQSVQPHGYSNGHPSYTPYPATDQSSPRAVPMTSTDLPRPPSAHSPYPPPQQPPQKHMPPQTPSQANGFHPKSSPAPVFPSEGSLQFPRPEGPTANPVPIKHASPSLPPLHPHHSPSLSQPAPHFYGPPRGSSHSPQQSMPISPVKRSPHGPSHSPRHPRPMSPVNWSPRPHQQPMPVSPIKRSSQFRPSSTPEPRPVDPNQGHGAYSPVEPRQGAYSPTASAMHTSPLLPPAAGGMSPRKRPSPPHSFGSPPPGSLHNPTGQAPGIAPFTALNGASWNHSNRLTSAGATAMNVSDGSKGGLPGILSSSPRGYSPIKHMPGTQPDGNLEALPEAAHDHISGLGSPIKMNTNPLPVGEQSGSSFESKMDVDEPRDA
ncbi:hypothetical protein P152DRAFT_456485 [Eremomyces bilateralis CBS 781.70]|uniref:PHD-type domain-containing protein n=1 Tax=Eremomyces bilateralis CBS 781.70 TaxID=1392243 RepID=A0A6G1G8K2_9PEZI|nr:uncharacterized protein P152DRAFT_456485 [Eremomyces bilateralis CBS 781.70]KAF1814256.1 hypothetical protein P152DRAFT_456485 [Eremomyces bilateralis CBS 781.70]